MVAAALIGAAGSLLGGIFGKSKQKVYTNDQGIMDSAKGAREASEQYGFNPLTLLGATGGAGAVYGGQNTMGSAISDAALLLADGLKDKSAEKAELENIQLQNEVLRAQVRDLTIRPKVGGIYAGNVSTPGVGNVASNGSVVGAVGQTDGAAPAGSGVRFFGQVLKPNPSNSDAQDQENRYGDFASWFGGVGNLLADLGYTYGPSIERAVAPYAESAQGWLVDQRVKAIAAKDSSAIRSDARRAADARKFQRYSEPYSGPFFRPAPDYRFRGLNLGSVLN